MASLILIVLKFLQILVRIYEFLMGIYNNVSNYVLTRYLNGRIIQIGVIYLDFKKVDYVYNIYSFKNFYHDTMGETFEYIKYLCGINITSYIYVCYYENNEKREIIINPKVYSIKNVNNKIRIEVNDSYNNDKMAEVELKDIIYVDINSYDITVYFKRYYTSFIRGNITVKDLAQILKMMYNVRVPMGKLTWMNGETLDETVIESDKYIEF